MVCFDGEIIHVIKTNNTYKNITFYILIFSLVHFNVLDEAFEKERERKGTERA